MTSDNTNPWDEPTRWDATRGSDDSAAPADAAPAPPPVPPAPAAPADLPVFGTPQAAQPPTPPQPPVAPPVVTPPTLPNAGAPVPPPAAATPPPMPPAAPGSAIGSQPIPAMPSSAPPGAPAGQPLLTGNYGGTDAPVVAAPASSGGGNGRFAWIAAIIGAIALLGGGAFFALTAFGASGGGETPEDAVDQMLVAINGEDFLTIGELLDPAERRTIVEPVLTDILPELERLGVFDESLDPADVDGVDFELADVTYRIDPLADDLQAVYFTSGTASSSSTAAEFPWGDAIRDRFSDNFEDTPRTTEDIDDDGTPLVLVERDGRWYFSMWHSIAEQARLESGDNLPLVGDMPVALGSDSPADAVEAMIQDMVDLDIRNVIGRMDPAEAAALYRYSPIFLGEAEGELNSVRRDAAAEGITWEITDMEFDTEEDGDDAIVTVRAFTATVTTPDIDVAMTWSRDLIRVEVNATIDGETVNGSLEVTPRQWTLIGSAAGESVDIRVEIDPDAETISLTGDISGESIEGQLAMDADGVCSEFSFRGMDADESGCLEELLEEGGVDDSFSRLQVTQFFAAIDDEYPGIPMAVHRTDGAWYVSPTMSVMHAVTEGLEGVTREDFETFLDDLESTTDAFTIEDLVEAPFDAADDAPFDVLDLGDDDDFGDITDAVADDPTIDDPAFAPETSQEFTAAPGSEPSYLTGTLASNEHHRYVVSMEVGQTLGVTLYGTVLEGGIGDPLLRLDDPSGFEVAYNDDADGLNSALTYTAVTSGEHVIEVRDLGGNAGNYELGFELDDEGSTPSIVEGAGGPVDDPIDDPFELASVPTGLVQVANGSTISVSDTLEPDSYDVWDLVVDEPVTLTITALGETGTEIDTNVSVVNLDGDLLGYNDDAAPEAGLENFYDSYLVIDVPAGTYTIEVHSFGDNDSGGYDLIVAAN